MQNNNSTWLKSQSGLIHLGLALVTSGTLIAALFLPWFELLEDGKPIFQMKGWASGLDIWIWLSILAVPASIFLSKKGPSLWGSVILAWFGSWWMLFALAALTSGEAFRQAIDGIFHVTDAILKQAQQENLVQTPNWLFQAGSVWILVLCSSLLLLAQSIWLLVQANKAKNS